MSDSNPAAPGVPIGVLSELPTPCLVIDLAAVDRNIEAAAARFRAGAIRLRPHFKAHKCTALLKRQLAAGGTEGVTCQTSWEACVLARAGFDDILIANQIVDRHALSELAWAAARARLTVVVDCVEHVQLLERLTADHGVELGVLIELDVGPGRCGVVLGDPSLVPLVAAVVNAAGLTFAGLQAYEGHAVLRAGRSVRRTMVWQAAAQVAHERDRLRAAGLEVPRVSGGGTGTLDLAHDIGTLDEVQAGSYVLMDARYDSLDLAFEPALFCATTVVSRRSQEGAVLNAGLKEYSVEYGLPRVLGSPMDILGASDEHTRLHVPDGLDVAVGDQVLLVPAHVDPTVNLHDTLFVWTGSDVERWPVDGRRRLVT